MIPRVAFFTTSSIDPTDPLECEVSGRGIVISWLGLVLEISIGRRRP